MYLIYGVVNKYHPSTRVWALLVTHFITILTFQYL